MSKTDEELRQLAIDLYHNRVFTSGHMTKDELQGGMIFHVFIPLALATKEQRQEIMAAEPFLFYAYYRDAGPMCVNGLPTFFSVSLLTFEEAQRMAVFHEQYEKLHKAFASPQ